MGNELTTTLNSSLGLNLGSNSDPSSSSPSSLQVQQFKPNEDITVMLDVGQMKKQFLKELKIIWIDQQVESPDKAPFVLDLQNFGDVKKNTEFAEALEEIKDSKAVCFVLAYGLAIEKMNELATYPNVEAISIYNYDQNCRNVLIDLVNNKKAIMDGFIQNAVQSVKSAIWYWEGGTRSSLKVDLPAFAPIFDEEDKSELNEIHLFLKGLIYFENREQAKKNFLDLSRAIYAADPREQQNIEDFLRTYKEYEKKQILNWYTKETFLYKMCNNCLRIKTADSIQYCRLPLRDIETAIKEVYKEGSKNFSGMLYRGTYLSKDEWATLTSNVGKEIEMYGFLSTSHNKGAAQAFAKMDPVNKAFVTFIVPGCPGIGEQGFADVKMFSDFQGEEEVLFNVRSRFTILETTSIQIDNVTMRHLVLLYGAQAWRRYLLEEKPTCTVMIDSSKYIKCLHCERILDVSKIAMLFHYLSSPPGFCCPNCLNESNAPLLCIPSFQKYATNPSERKIATFKLKGLALPYDKDVRVPFYGYKCVHCQKHRPESVFQCIDCFPNKVWCKNCMPKISECTSVGHKVVYERNPFSFWCHVMPEKEKNHLIYQNSLLKVNKVLIQAQIFDASHNYDKAIMFYEAFLKSQAKDDVKLEALAYNNLGLMYDRKGDYIKALQNFQKAHQLTVLARGKNHLDTAASFNNLGLIYTALGDYPKAQENHTNALEIRKKEFGLKHPGTANSYNNMGLLSATQGDSQKAIELYLKALEIYKLTGIVKHPDAAITHNYLGLLYHSLGNYGRAIEQLNLSLDIRRAVFGDKHPDTAASYNNLGLVSKSVGVPKKAFQFYKRALDIQKTLYQGKHPEIATSLNNLGSLYQEQGKLQEAKTHFNGALEIYLGIYGEKRRETAIAYNNIAILCEKMQDFAGAEASYKKALEIKKTINGENHLDTALTYHNMATLYQLMGEIEEAKNMVKKALKIRIALLKTDHPDVAISHNNLGTLYEILGNYNKSSLNYHKALEINKKLYGEESAVTATSYHNLGVILYRLKDYDKALEMSSKAIQLRTKIYGDKHQATIDAINNQKVISQRKQNKSVGPMENILGMFN